VTRVADGPVEGGLVLVGLVPGRESASPARSGTNRGPSGTAALPHGGATPAMDSYGTGPISWGETPDHSSTPPAVSPPYPRPEQTRQGSGRRSDGQRVSA
jgi:hypothetical protein